MCFLLALANLNVRWIMRSERFIAQPMPYLVKYLERHLKKFSYISLKVYAIYPVLLYGFEACVLIKDDLRSINFTATRFFMKLFRTSNSLAIAEFQNVFRN